jgi:hypothetical protein
MSGIVRWVWTNMGEGSCFQEFINKTIDIPIQPITGPSAYVLRNPLSAWAVTG